MFRRLCAITVLAALALVGAALPQDEAAATSGSATITKVQFRDLFNAKGKPSDLAVALNGQLIYIEGFQAPPPTRKSPFLVFVGAKTTKCPYCNSLDDEEHLPYMLVYPHEGHDQITSRARLRAVGVLEASHEDEAFFGIHNDVRLLNATVASALQQVRRRAPIAGEVVLPTVERVIPGIPEASAADRVADPSAHIPIDGD